MLHHARDQHLAALSFRKLVEVCVPVVQSRHGEKPNVAVTARDDS